MMIGIRWKNATPWGKEIPSRALKAFSDAEAQRMRNATTSTHAERDHLLRSTDAWITGVFESRIQNEKKRNDMDR